MMMSETKNKNAWLEQPFWLALNLNWEKVLHIGLILLAVLTRFYDLGARVISHDESLHTFYSYELYRGKGFVHTPLMHGTVHFLGNALSYTLFGVTDFTARIPAALCGVLAVALMYQFRHWLGRTGALLGAVFMLISPYMLYYTRYVREDPYTIVFALLMALSLFHYMERREAKWIYIMSAATALMYATKEVSFIYVAIWLVFLGFIYIKDMLQAQWAQPSLKVAYLWSLMGALAFGVIAAGIFLWSARSPDALPIPVVGGTAAATATVGGAPVDVLNQALLVVGGLAGLCLALAGAASLISFKWDLRNFASIDVMIVQLTFVLPQLTALPVKFLLKADPLDYSQPGLLRTALVFAPMMLVAAGVGLLWNWKRWSIAAGIFYGIFVTLFTTLFTNGGGFFTGAVGSLGYWLEQHGVQRGSQPWYFYILVQTPIYEFLPAIGSLIAFGFGLWYWARQMEQQGEAATGAAVDNKFPALLFSGYWAIAAYIAYSWAGEKMPWLQVHNTIPMILLAGWSFGKIFDAIDWEAFKNKLGWVAALLSPLVLYAFGYALFIWLGTNRPFAGNELPQLQATSSFLFALVVLVVGGAALYQLVAQGLGWKQVLIITANVFTAILILLTVRVTVYANYINYDQQTEFINYASGAPAVKVVLAQVEEISKRTTDGYGIRVAYDDDVSWPLTWYMRDYPNQVFYGAQPTREAFADVPLIIAGGKNWPKVEPLLGDRYYMFEYIRMWWPMQDYFNLDGPRISNALTDARYREALFDIWFYRDYKKYGQLTNVEGLYQLSKWPVSDRMRFYIRKDVAAKMWSLGVGPTALKPAQEDPYAKNKQALTAEVVWGVAGNGDGQFNSPRAVAAAPSGMVYVADTRNHRIQQFDPSGKFVRAWGKFGKVEDGTGVPGAFNEIWGIAVDKQGNVFAADTWNHRIQKFNANGELISTWGTFGLPEAGLGVMWGPRGVAVDASGNVYVADTGNKRVLVFDNNGKPLRAIGSSGVLQGQLDEPTGVAVASDGRVFIADTWNQRVQAFSPEGAYLGQWQISGWYGQSLDNKPQLALDGQGLVYVVDPEQSRVLVFNEAGQFQYMFGEPGTDNQKFMLPAGVAAANDKLFVVDAATNRVLQFAVKAGGAK